MRSTLHYIYVKIYRMMRDEEEERVGGERGLIEIQNVICTKAVKSFVIPVCNSFSSRAENT